MGQGQAKDAGGDEPAVSFCVPEPAGESTLSEEELHSLLADVRAGNLRRRKLNDEKRMPLPRNLGQMPIYQAGIFSEEKVTRAKDSAGIKDPDVRALKELVGHLEKSELAATK